LPNLALSFDAKPEFPPELGSGQTGRHPKQEADMTVYMVERDLKGISMDALAGAQQAAIATAATMRGAGESIRYIRSTFAPEDGRCMCLFDGTSAEQVAKLNDTAGLPYSRVVPALDLTP
jgi:hypothetical protein